MRRSRVSVHGMLASDRGRVQAHHGAAADSDADTLVVGVFEGEDAGSRRPCRRCSTSGEAKRAHGALALTHEGARRWLLAGLGQARRVRRRARARERREGRASEPASSERGRCAGSCPTAAATSASRRALVEGTVLASYRFDRYKEPPKDEAERAATLEQLTISAPAEIVGAPSSARGSSPRPPTQRAVLQDTPANDMTPTDLAEPRARARRGARRTSSVSVEGRAEIVAPRHGSVRGGRPGHRRRSRR